jgi:ATP-binding cassette, subfamily B, bacterial PglK
MIFSHVYNLIWPHIEKRFRFRIQLLVVLSIFTSFAEMLSVGAFLPFLSVITMPEKVFKHELSQPIIVFFQYTNAEQLVAPIFYLFSLAVLTAMIFRFSLLWLQTTLSSEIGVDLSVKAYEKTLSQPYRVHISNNSSRTIAIITQKIRTVVMSVIQPMLFIVSSLFIVIGLGLMLFFISPSLTIIFIVVFGSMFVFANYLSKRHLVNNGGIISVNQDRMIKALQESIGGIREIIMFPQSFHHFISTFKDSCSKLNYAHKANIIIAGSPRFIIETVAILLFSLFAYLYIEDDNIVPILGGLALSAQKMLPILQKIYQNFSQIRSGIAALHDTLELLNQPMLEDKGTLKESPVSLQFNDAITLDNIFFNYSSSDLHVINKASLKIKKGERLGVIGDTGCGKSTLIDIIMCLLDPDKGSLSVDAIPITTHAQKNAWRSMIAHIPQEIFLLDDTILKNIAYGFKNDEIDFIKVVESAKKANIDKDIKLWDKQYNTIVGEKGVSLSGGERQRIGIARALYKNSEVIILDEATSALDGKTERDVMESMHNHDCSVTMIVIAHRLTTLSVCDRIIKLDGGKIRLIGSYQDLVNSSVE